MGNWLATHAWVLTFVVLLSSCGEEGMTPLSVDALYGAWQDTDEATQVVRVFVFEESNETYPDLAGLSPVYRLYLFNQGQTPLVIQRGTFGVEENHLLTHVTWTSADLFGDVGDSYANEIFVWNGDSFTMESKATAGQREYSMVDPAPYQ